MRIIVIDLSIPSVYAITPAEIAQSTQDMRNAGWPEFESDPVETIEIEPSADPAYEYRHAANGR